MSTSLPPLTGLSPDLTRDELLSRLQNALVFARKTIERLGRSIAHGGESDEGPRVQLIDKTIVETSLLAYLSSRIEDAPEEIRSAVDALARRLSPLVRSERSRVFLMRFPHTAATIASAHVYLSRLGERDESFDALWSRAFASGHVEAVERLPYRSMDVRWLRGLSRTAPPPGFEDLLPHSTIASGAHPIYMTREDAYAVTHALMYATDFGLRRLPAPLDRDRTAAMIDAGLAWNIMSEDLDLLGELLLGAAVLRRPWSPYARFAWCMFATTWDEFGFLPGPNFDAQEYSSLEGDEASDYAFEHLYHTNYVGGILCAVLLRHPESGGDTTAWTASTHLPPDLLGRCERAVASAVGFCEGQGFRPSSSPNQGESRAGATPGSPDGDLGKAVARALECPGFCGSPEARWAQVLEHAPLDKDELALVLSDATLIQAARSYDLALLARGLSDAAYLTSSTPSATCVEAAAFVVHQQLPSGAIGAHFTVEENVRSPNAAVVTISLAASLYAAARRLAEFASVPFPSSSEGRDYDPLRDDRKHANEGSLSSGTIAPGSGRGRRGFERWPLEGQPPREQSS